MPSRRSRRAPLPKRRLWITAEPCSTSPSRPTSAPFPTHSAVALRSASARSIKQLPERLAVAVDQRLEIDDVPAGERVLDDGARRDQPRRGHHRLSALALDVLDDRDHLAQTVERHGASISRPGGR